MACSVVTMRIAESKVTSKFQLTIPKDVRNAINVSQGDTVAFLVEGKTVLLARRHADPLEALEALREGRWFPELGADLKKTRKEDRRGKDIR
ncbi:MAG: AbrB/MazE/SpoVT family DNA-binding domain-containing protein [Candidatus Micrarchaeota archaeon]|nr:AbrB/MazE/SpoVT family DNA-binding domain-containing protein [Candidatus Micrarchaeota archaeon]